MDINLERNIIRRYKSVRNLGDVSVGVPDRTLTSLIVEETRRSDKALDDLAETVKSLALNIYESANRISRQSGLVPDITPSFGEEYLLTDGVGDIAREIQGIAARAYKNLSRIEPFNLYDYDMLQVPGAHHAMLDRDLDSRIEQIRFLSSILYPMAAATSGAESNVTIAEFLQPKRIYLMFPLNKINWTRDEFNVFGHLAQLRERCSLFHLYIDAAFRRDQLDEMLDAFNGLTPSGVQQLLEMVAENGDAPLGWMLSAVEGG